MTDLDELERLALKGSPTAIRDLIAEVRRLRAALSDAVDFASEGWDPAQPWDYSPRVERWREVVGERSDVALAADPTPVVGRCPACLDSVRDRDGEPICEGCGGYVRALEER